MSEKARPPVCRTSGLVMTKPPQPKEHQPPSTEAIAAARDVLAGVNPDAPESTILSMAFRIDRHFAGLRERHSVLGRNYDRGERYPCKPDISR